MKRILDWLGPKTDPRNFRGNPLDSLPDFQNFLYKIAIKPAGSRVDAWTKLCESERRLAMYRWVEQYIDPANPQHRILLNDSVSAFLLTFEAAIQFLKDQFGRCNTATQFDRWFTQQPQNNVSVKGLRTLRHLEAHIESKPIPRTVNLHIHSSLGGKKQGAEITSCIWRLPQLTASDLTKLRNRPLAVTDLSDWKDLVGMQDAKTVFADSLLRLKDILETAETIV